MKLTVKRPEEYAVSVWAGGKTTQLYIYPEDAEYAKRNFLFRLSSATVECEQSEFTSLPGVDRIIMPLRGSLHLYYEGHGEKVLREYEQDSFDGGWQTTSMGRATDFNLMMRGVKGRLEVLELAAGQSRTLCNQAGEILAVYAAEGECRCTSEESLLMPEKSLAVASEAGTFIVQNNGDICCKLVCARVQIA